MAIPPSSLTRTDSISSVSSCTSTRSSISSVFDPVERERINWEDLILNKDYTLPFDRYFEERGDSASPHLLHAFRYADILRLVANRILVTGSSNLTTKGQVLVQQRRIKKEILDILTLINFRHAVQHVSFRDPALAPNQWNLPPPPGFTLRGPNVPIAQPFARHPPMSLDFDSTASVDDAQTTPSPVNQLVAELNKSPDSPPPSFLGLSPHYVSPLYHSQNSPPPSIPPDTLVAESVIPYTPTPRTTDDPILSITPMSLPDPMLVETYYLYPDLTRPNTPITAEEDEGPIEMQQELMIPPPPSPIMIDCSHTPPSRQTAFHKPLKYHPGWVPQTPANTTLPIPPPQPNLGRTGRQRHRKYFRGPRLFSTGLAISPLHNNPPAFPAATPSTSTRIDPPGENYTCRNCKVIGHRHSH